MNSEALRADQRPLGSGHVARFDGVHLAGPGLGGEHREHPGARPNIDDHLRRNGQTGRSDDGMTSLVCLAV